MGAILRLQPEFVPKAHTPKSSANSCFVSAGLYAGVFLGSIIMWRRDQARGIVASLKEAAPLDLFGTKLSFEDLDDLEEVEPLVENLKAPTTTRRVPSPSIQQL
ncbi:Aste57867_8991 [Aphanomyces stellatus]|uniref:Aste57867_8991 protein n=1 Tax=Aphanomyces stellatus TaxID=120398 RepID=A0A485KLM9_9STRA|nr:hypothetical protein As57867_008956 [Aphanomyces stellatus]VFT85875.1 Aste57867_8991 [Aphanomyces stellatus]